MWATVNAPVDEGIAELIEALARFPHLQTIESCEGGVSNHPWVCFVYGAYWENPWRDLAHFVLGYLGPRLMQELGDGVSVSIHVRESGTVQGELSVNPSALQGEIKALIRLSRAYGD